MSTKPAGRGFQTVFSAAARPSIGAPTEIFETQDPSIYETGREGHLSYQIPLTPGIYELRLYFAETAAASDTLRIVNIAVNGALLPTLDVASDAGGINTATTKIFRDISPAKDGFLHLSFMGGGPSFLNALEIVPGLAGKIRPIRFTARDTPFRDHLGRVWLPDPGLVGGRKSNHPPPNHIDGTDDPGLYHDQRIGHFAYSVPVAEGGKYTVTLYFAETWFGNPNSGGIGSRVFDVYCNGTTLMKNFDILKETGGVPLRALVKTFHDVPASPQGKLDLSFVPVVNYAMLSAIEVTQE